MLEGKEIEGKFDGDAGAYSIDADMTGKVVFTLSYEKDLGDVKVKNTSEVETHILDILTKVAAKTKTTLDDIAIAKLKQILGLVG